MVAMALGYIVVNLYLTGGVLDRLVADTPRPWAWFFGACQRHFWRLTLIGLCILPLFAVLVALPHIGLTRLVEHLSADAVGPGTSFAATWVHWGVVFLLFSVVARMYDYARIALVTNPDRGAIAAVGAGVVFTLRHGIGTLILWGLLVAVPIGLMFAHLQVSALIGATDMAAVWLGLAIGQLFVLLRIAGGIAVLGGQMRVFLS